MIGVVIKVVVGDATLLSGGLSSCYERQSAVRAHERATVGIWKERMGRKREGEKKGLIP